MLAGNALKRVAAAIIWQGGKVLAAQRAADDRLALKWEFPGGKLEAGETPEECLRREIKEELGLNIAVKGHFMTGLFRQNTGMLELMAYFAEIESGGICLNVHAAVRWIAPQELMTVDFAPADLPIAHKLSETAGVFTETK